MKNAGMLVLLIFWGPIIVLGIVEEVIRWIRKRRGRKK